MAKVKHARLHVEFHGAKDGEPLLLIHGLGCNVKDWSSDFIDHLVRGGCRVILVDNRDVGHSERFDTLGRPPMLWAMVAHILKLPSFIRPKAKYSLSDMAADVVAAMVQNGIASAHIVGVSMGGMIGQRIAIEYPHFIKSLTSIMSSSGKPSLPNPERQVTKLLTSGSSSDDPTLQLTQAIEFRRLIAGNMQATDVSELVVRVGHSHRYGVPHGPGAERQYFSILSDQDRFSKLHSINCPVTVVHGAIDPFVPPEHGRDTAQRIRGARYIEIEGMGHEILRSNAAANADAVLSTVFSTSRLKTVAA